MFHFFKTVSRNPLRWFVLRGLAAFAAIALGTSLRSGINFTEPAFYYELHFMPVLILWGIAFAALCLIRSDIPVYCLLVFGGLLYCCVCAVDAKDWAFSLALCAALFVLLWFFELPRLPSFYKTKLLWIILAALICFYTLYVGGLCCVNYRRYHTPCYDFGLFAQMFYYMKETGRCLITCERDRLLSHFAVHFSPIYYLYLPVYSVFPSPETLLILQPLTVAGGAVPLALLCRKKGLSDTAALGFSICFLMYPAFMGGCFWYLHENCFLSPLLLWLVYFFEKRKTVPIVLFAALTLAVKEDAAVYVAATALYFLFAHKNYKSSISVLLLSVVYFVTVTRLIGVYGDGIMDKSRYGVYMFDNKGLFSVIETVFLNPAFALKQIFAKEKMLFILQMLVPLCFLPVPIKKPARLLLFVPLILVNLMTPYVYQYHIGYQYTFGSGALLLYLSVLNYADLGKHRSKALFCAVLFCAVLFCGGFASKTDALRLYRSQKQQRTSIDTALSLIPPDAEVAASTFLLANLSQRDVIWELESTKQKAQYIAMDLRFDKDRTIEPYVLEGYAPLYYDAGVVAVLYKNEE